MPNQPQVQLAPADYMISNQDRILADFPILQQRIHKNRRLIYLDNAASTQRPQAVIDAMSDFYEKSYANVHRGIHFLSEQSTAVFEACRRAVQAFIHAAHAEEIIFTSGTTASINLVARSWGDANLSTGDRIILTELEHHSNIVPWQQLSLRTGARIEWARVTEHGELDVDHMKELLNQPAKLVAFTALSNTLGTRLPVTDIVRMAQAAGAIAVVDAAQHVPHETTSVTQWGADFVAFSGHKMLGPSGIGILYGKRELLEQMPPFLGGGNMIAEVTKEGFTPGFLPSKFEAGTPPIAEAAGLLAAIEYLNNIGMEEITNHEAGLIKRCMQLASQIDGLRVLGPPADKRAAIFSFVAAGMHPQDIAVLLDLQGVAVRVGHHCTMPLHQRFGLSASCRASFYLYNTLQDVDDFVEILNRVLCKLIGSSPRSGKVDR
ncbi:MAG TPA: SufS family cysteine desulfurase [Pirellulaceae bacterium]|nr:SufS family cysteine desulfurase [Pirellulaceae bacterium]HMO94021.1 SufS family cysteine desulfurase [Pirellulaceae bacterium]HMP70782.1 SufS family cysteine desulfurase [Pirellulaceae bacterium]